MKKDNAHIEESRATQGSQGFPLEDISQNNDVMISVDNTTMVFNMASEQLNNLKEYFIKLAKRQLFFKEFYALNDISFKVNRGDVFGIIGTNGSGKSTLMKIIAGVLDPTEGTVEVNGKIAPLIELGAGFDMELTARENIYLNGALLGYSKKFIGEHFNEIVEFAEMESFLDMPLKNYSSGMVARIAFAIATVIVPEILIVDEVLSVGDFMFQRKCEDRINELIYNYGVTVLIVSHSNDQIERLCNKAIWIEKGHTRMCGSTKDVCSAYRLLGGKTGSTTAEQAILKQLDCVDNDSVLSKRIRNTIAGEDHYGAASKICSKGWTATETDTVIIAVGTGHTDALIATGLASLYGAPVLLTKADVFSEVTLQQVERLAPRRIILIDGRESMSESAYSELLEVFGDNCIIYKIGGQNICETSRLVYQFGIENSLDGISNWSDTAILTTSNIGPDLLSLSPYIYRKKAAIFLTEPDGVVSDFILNALTDSFKQVIILGGINDIKLESEEWLRKHSLDVIRLAGYDVHDANKKIIQWILEESPLKNFFSLSNLFIASAYNPFDALTAGALAGKNGSVILFDDIENLDIVALSLQFIESHKESIKTFTFFGGNMRFGDIDQKLLTSVVYPKS